MMEWYLSLTAMEKVYFYSAAIGGMLFFVRMIMMLIGGHHEGSDGHIDVDGGGHDFHAGDHSFDDHGHGFDDHAHTDSDMSFKLLTMQGLTAFFAFFGLAGLALRKEFGFSEIAALIGSGAVGYGSMYGVAKLFSLFLTLQSSGTLNLQNAVGQEGKVYLTIPASGGTGQVEVTVQDRLKVLSAATEDQEEIKTGERVRVSQVVSGNILIVEKIE